MNSVAENMENKVEQTYVDEDDSEIYEIFVRTTASVIKQSI